MENIGLISPYKKLFGVALSYDQLHIISCLFYISKMPTPSDKLEARGFKCVFLGYAHGKKGYRVYDMASKCIKQSHDVILFQSLFLFR